LRVAKGRDCGCVEIQLVLCEASSYSAIAECTRLTSRTTIPATTTRTLISAVAQHNSLTLHFSSHSPCREQRRSSHRSLHALFALLAQYVVRIVTRVAINGVCSLAVISYLSTFCPTISYACSPLVVAVTTTCSGCRRQLFQPLVNFAMSSRVIVVLPCCALAIHSYRSTAPL